MRTTLFPAFAAAITLLASCATQEELAERRKPVPPNTETSKIPWNQPIGGQGMGQMGMMMQNQHRR
ncbi:MAG: hypothetical protein V4733_07985 [Verrucomicrobiota bacterium]